MAFDEGLAHRVRELLEDRRDLVEKRMFGGIGFMVGGNMCVGVYKDDLIVRFDPSDYPAAAAKPHTKPFDITGRPMKGWLMVAPEGLEDDADLEGWVERSLAFASSLPPK